MKLNKTEGVSSVSG